VYYHGEMSLNIRKYFSSTNFPPALTLISCSIYSTLKMEAIYSSETSVDFKVTTRGYIPDDITLHNRRCDHLESYVNTCLPYFRTVDFIVIQ
jgi:hypothetical protein